LSRTHAPEKFVDAALTINAPARNINTAAQPVRNRFIIVSLNQSIIRPKVRQTDVVELSFGRAASSLEVEARGRFVQLLCNPPVHQRASSQVRFD